MWDPHTRLELEESISSKGNRLTRSWSGTELGEVHVTAVGSVVASELDWSQRDEELGFVLTLRSPPDI